MVALKDEANGFPSKFKIIPFYGVCLVLQIDKIILFCQKYSERIQN